MANATARILSDILSDKQLEQILCETMPGSQLLSYDLRPASEGLGGFLGEHFRLTLNVNHKNIVKKIHLFVKSLPLDNKAKEEFIFDGNFTRRENLMFGLFDQMPGDCEPNPWRTRALIHDERVIVMLDLSVEGYKTYPLGKIFDRTHALVAISSLARFHAAFCNYVTKRSVKTPYNFLKEHSDVLDEPSFKDSPWLTTGARLTASILKEFSMKEYPDDLADKLNKLYIRACDTVKEYDDTLNVVIHKDLWTNNILFKYSKDLPTHAILIDFQCIRYAPPAFDVMIFLYFTTSREFRDRYESEIINHYFTIFSLNLNDPTKIRLNDTKYDRAAFLHYCNKARLIALIVTALIAPYAMMEPIAAAKYFDDPDTFTGYLKEDRSYPVITHAKENAFYKNRLLDISEEIVEKYMVHDNCS